MLLLLDEIIQAILIKMYLHHSPLISMLLISKDSLTSITQFNRINFSYFYYFYKDLNQQYHLYRRGNYNYFSYKKSFYVLNVYGMST